MKRLVLLLLLAALMPLARPAAAAPASHLFAGPLRIAGQTVVVPPEWDGIWFSEDSTYDCGGEYLFGNTFEDTLCAGQEFFTGDPSGGMVVLTCTGTADATTVQMTCSGSAEFVPDCTVTYTFDIDAVRTGDTMHMVSIMNIIYDGTGLGCDLIPDQCMRTVADATRTGPAPPEYCATPARAESWGKLKLRYR